MYRTRHIYSFLIAVFIMSACSTDEVIEEAMTDQVIPVQLSIGDNGDFTRAPGDVALSVNRILILPFRKTNESLADDPANFVPDYGAAKQIDVNSFPAVSTKLNLLSTSTYRIMVIGYNRSDYDFGNRTSPTRRFSIGYLPMTETLANTYLQPMSPTSVPEFFTCMGIGYLKEAQIGFSFKPGQISLVKANLKRIVSGFTLEISNIPSFVTSMSLIAEQLVTAVRNTDGAPLQWQTAGDSGSKVLGSKTPVSGKITFSNYMLATLDARKTLFYIDVTYGAFTQRYTLKIADKVNVVSSNRIIFTPNYWVKVTGNYTNINLGFILTDNINLDDNSWDGLH